jgi:hypothetical protein
MDKFFDVAYERNQAGKRHHYLAVRWDHWLQGKHISHAVSSLAITQACTISKAGYHQPTAHAVHRVVM